MKAIKILSLLTILLVSNYSCKKEECLTATVRFTNIYTNPYDLFIDGIYQQEIPPNSFVELIIEEGQHSVRAEQVSGFLLFASEFSTTMSVFGCQENEWVIR